MVMLMISGNGGGDVGDVTSSGGVSAGFHDVRDVDGYGGGDDVDVGGGSGGSGGNADPDDKSKKVTGQLSVWW